MSGSYSQKLKDPRWQRKRLEALQAANWSCKSCKATHKTLHVHHTKYRGEPWEAPLDWLEVLCEDCHEKRHAPAKPLKIYFAGKIGKNDWRHKLIPGLRGAWLGHDCGEGVGDLIALQPVTWEQDGLTLHCTGPYFVGCNHGCFHGATNHGQISDYLGEETDDVEEDPFQYLEPDPPRPSSAEAFKTWVNARYSVYELCQLWLKNSDCIFAYINAEGAYGTLIELVTYDYPAAIYFSSEELLKSYWFFCAELQTTRERSQLQIGVSDCVKTAFSRALKFFSEDEEEGLK